MGGRASNTVGAMVFGVAIAACGGRVPPESDDAGTGGRGAGGTVPTGMGTAGDGGHAGSGVGGSVGVGGNGVGGSAGGIGGSGGAGGGNPPPTPPSDGCQKVYGLASLTSWIAFDSGTDGQRALRMVHPNGEGLHAVTDGTHLDKEPSLSPDGLKISFTSDRSKTPQVFVFDVVTLRIVQLTMRPEGADQSSFSRDGKSIAFHSGESVYVINLDGTGERLVATGLDNYNAYFWPHFSATGTELVFDRNNEINAATLDGKLRQIIQNTTTTIRGPAVSPDGTEIAYAVQCQTGPLGPGSIWTAPFGSLTRACEGRRASADEGFEARHATWGSKDVIAYERVNTATGLTNIVAISRAPGSAPCAISPPDIDSRNPDWLP